MKPTTLVSVSKRTSAHSLKSSITESSNGKASVCTSDRLYTRAELVDLRDTINVFLDAVPATESEGAAA